MLRGGQYSYSYSLLRLLRCTDYSVYCICNVSFSFSLHLISLEISKFPIGGSYSHEDPLRVPMGFQIPFVFAFSWPARGGIRFYIGIDYGLSYAVTRM